MSFFNSFMDAASSLTNSMLGDKDTTVKTINVDAYVRTPVHCRQDGLVLYGPHENGRYELVFLRPYSSSSASQGFSLLRTPDIERAESEFGNLHLKFPLLSEIVKDFASQVGIVGHIFSEISWGSSPLRSRPMTAPLRTAPPL
ncbi:unnamed protein product [Cyprideis torosa]|uniref:Uncharacterized protein n=1 Tax=Cyprideis torosa TaxID=163714 RepID=A0A7R8WQZ5_9CRUS|nr:unnamed protein product [Cyprideis torosa]CAG0908378.1 unnamed protein product [Cyprideis torosa]